ncbi:hypothetical protein FisN_UnNu078 [Fistulifera solaris]|uniref:GYF domain-containing protein n=1 Tax=Fistulifera solaris TaxID=1519565 RepID=A0A1Z5JPH7_FISSO|nr:hypothetical protein FisN_UnNu078 [Fistulifera solaris]|eukprot:GAX15927.1 hypothetical protein FisN_UnNu078 [Fistulifera solaris]
MPQGNSNKSSSVRFAEDTKPDEPHDDNHAKRKSERPNAYEEDDIDEWSGNDDDEPDIYSKEIQQAQKKRRYQDDEEDTITNINATTSLASEGIAVEPFHMKQEESDGTGFFDGDTYIFRRDNKEEPDAWLDGLENNNSSNEEPAVRSVSRPREKPRAESENWDSMEPAVLYARMIPLVSESETVLKAIARYGNSMKRTPQGETNQLAQDALNLLTSASNSLLLRGQVDIYEKTQKDLLQLLPEEKHSRDSSTSTVQWEYEGRQDGKIHGPYSTADMLSWIQAGYFVGESAVNVRTVQKKVKSMQDDLMGDLLEDDDDDENQNYEDEYERGEWVLSDQVNFAKYQ